VTTVEQTAQSSRAADRRYFDPIEAAPRAEVLALQERRLLEQVAYVTERSPVVRETWKAAGVRAQDIRSTEDFKARVPFMDKETLRNFREKHDDPLCGVLCREFSEISNIGTSSGTSGDPTVFTERWTDPGEWVLGPRAMWELGLRPGSLICDIQFVMRSIGRRWFHDLGAVSLMFNHDASDLPRLVEWCKKYRPTWFFHLSSPLIYGFARLEAEQGLDVRDVFSSFDAVIYGGEPMGRKARELVKRWEVPVYEFTSLGDCGTGWECRARDGFHAWEDLVLFEVLDPITNEPVPSGGRGEMVITSLTDRTDPLIRFRSDDLVKWTDAKCECGRTHARYWPLGRVGDEILVNGKSVLPRDVWSAIEDVPETDAGLFQIIRPQRELSELKLRVGYEGTPNRNDLAGRVADSVEKAVGIRPEIELITNADIVKLGPPHKIPRTAKK